MADYRIARRVPGGLMLDQAVHPTYTAAVSAAADEISRTSRPRLFFNASFDEFVAGSQDEYRVLLDLGSTVQSDLPALLQHDPVLAAVYRLGLNQGRRDAKVCPDCNGSGYASTIDGRALGTCPTCDGYGGEHQ
jgi:DnaJ-class molecular chaperone